MLEPPLVLEIPWLDPVAAYAALAGAPWSMLLDGSAPEHPAGRHAFVLARPYRTMTSDGVGPAFARRANPFDALRGLLQEVPPAATVPGIPPFQGGAAGYFGYDLCHHLERLPRPPADDLRFPELMVGLYDLVVSFDVVARRAWIVSTGRPASTPGARRRRATERAEEVRARLAGARELDPPSPAEERVDWCSNFASRAAYEAAVAHVVDSILAGEVFQVNLAQRFRAALPEDFDPFEMYRRLRDASPAPFAAYLDLGDVIVASHSPERFLELRGDRVETRPIKGTRPRGATPAEDDALAAELLTSEKDRAENVMIVDLLRNDLSRVCLDHSVRVPALCALESFSTVHHLVSTVEGRLAPGRDALDLLAASFPGGSVTGAPKVRAMELIAELEPHRRGPYCGAIGYVGFDGSLDTNIAIRTLALRDRSATFHVGGGILADSDPAAEYDETLDKARALFAAFAPPGSELP